jgi:hypothetical protein
MKHVKKAKAAEEDPDDEFAENAGSPKGKKEKS